MVQINAIGDVCPLPVVKTKKALGELVSGPLEVLVDNEIAVQNLQKLANSEGCSFKCSEQDGHFSVLIEKNEMQQAEDSRNPVVSESGVNGTSAVGTTVVVLSSAEMGNGDQELGEILMKSFVFALTQLDVLPDTVLLYNSGAKLAVQGAPVLNDLKELEQAGVKIMTCGTCLNHYGIAEQLGVGEVTNMYNIVEEMRQAGRVIRP